MDIIKAVRALEKGKTPYRSWGEDDLILKSNKDNPNLIRVRFRCGKGSCSGQKGTIFGGSPLSVDDILADDWHIPRTKRS